jgi:hypothetical protein
MRDRDSNSCRRDGSFWAEGLAALDAALRARPQW